MIDVTSLKSPGWQRVVAELSSPAGDDKAFYERLLRVLAQVSAARRAVLLAPSGGGETEEAEPRVVMSWPEGDGLSAEVQPRGAAGSAEHEREIKSAASAAFSSGGARAFGLEKESQYYDAGVTGGYVIAVPLHGVAAGMPRGEGQGAGGAAVAAVVVMVIEPRSKDAVRSTLAMAEVLAGYVYGHSVRQALRRTQTASMALDLATKLISSINHAPNFKGVSLQLVNDLVRQFGVDRVAMGWMKNDSVRVQAISDTEHFDRRMAMVQRLQAAMDECLDQEQPVMYPAPPAEGPQGDVLLAHAVVHSHRELAAGDARLKVCSIPLRADEDVLGVVTIESSAEGSLDPGAIELMQSAMDLVTPVLRVRRSDDRALALRAWDSAVRAAAWGVGPKHTVWKVVGLAAAALVLFVVFHTTTYKVTADAVIQPTVRRTISAPYDGVIKSIAAGLEPGLRVNAGDELVQLDTTQLELQRLYVLAQRGQAAATEAAALKAGDAEQAEKARAQTRQADAQIMSLDSQIERSRIRAPIGGTVIAGDLKNRVDGTVRLGDALLEVAQDEMIAVAQVDDRDIWLVKKAFDEGDRRGALVAKSRPGEAFELRIERIVPLAVAKDGKNRFEVRAEIVNPPEWMRPGSEAIAKIHTQRHSLAWIGTRRVIDAVRLWMW